MYLANYPNQSSPTDSTDEPYFYTREVRESVDKAMKLLEPALTMGLGIVMALIMWSVLSPVYDILGKLKL